MSSPRRVESRSLEKIRPAAPELVLRKYEVILVRTSLGSVVLRNAPPGALEAALGDEPSLANLTARRAGFVRRRPSTSREKPSRAPHLDLRERRPAQTHRGLTRYLNPLVVSELMSFAVRVE